MLKRLIHRQLVRFERATDCDATCLHELADASLGAFRRFACARAMSYFREDVPLDAWPAAGAAV